MATSVKSAQTSGSTLPPAEGLSLAERSYRAIRDQLVMLEIAPGAPINEDLLTRTLEVGRTPVREALKRLEHERLVVAYPRRGTFATDVNITDLAHISEVRLHLEPSAASSAARRATPPDRARLEELLSDLDRVPADSQPTPELMRLDMAVHRAIYAAAHNPYLEDTLIRYDNLATRIWCLFVDRLPTMAGHVAEHAPLLRAVLDGTATRAAELTRAHISGFERAIRKAI